MNAPAVTEQALTVPQQVDRALDFTATQAKLTELAAGSKDIVAITNKAGYDQVHAMRMVLKRTRINVETTAEEARKDARAFCTGVIVREKELIAIIRPEELRLEALQKAEDDRDAAVKAEAARIEAERIAAIEATIKGIADAPGEAIHFEADDLRGMIDKLRELDLSAMDEVYRPRAVNTQARAVADLQRMLGVRIQADETAAELVKARAEAERMRLEQAERDRIAAEALQAERDAAARKLADQEAALQAERAEADRIAADKQAAADARIAELEAAETARVAKAQAEAEAARIAQEARERDEAERLAAEQAEAERLRQAAADAENARLEAERAEAAERERALREAADREAIEKATLVEAATDALSMLVDLGYTDHLTVRKLFAAIHRAKPVARKNQRRTEDA